MSRPGAARCSAALMLAAAGWLAFPLPPVGADGVRHDRNIAFAARPTAARQGNRVTIRFAAATTCDATVAIEDAEGRTVRHLASGVLGRNSPPPFGHGLRQELTWDGRDDLGKPAPAGTYSVRVGLGLDPHLRKLVGFRPLGMGGVRGVAPMPAGGVCLLGNYWPPTMKVVVLARDGSFARQLHPPPASLDPAASPAIAYFRRGDGRDVPMLDTSPAVPKMGNTRSYACAMASCESRLVFFSSGLNRPCVLDLKTGGLTAPLISPAEDVKTVLDRNNPRWIRTLWGARSQLYVYGLAVSPDGRHAYVTGMTADGYFRPGKSKPYHAVFRFPLAGGRLEVFAGAMTEIGKSDGRLSRPVGLATDARGNVYVCDHGNDRIAVFDPKGTLVRALDVKAPAFVQVHARTGNLYVLTGSAFSPTMTLGTRGGVTLLKVSPAGKRLAAMELPGDRRPYGVFGPAVSMAVDAGDGAPVVWLGLQPAGYEAHGAILRIEDAGGTFRKPEAKRTDFNRYDPRYTYGNPNYSQHREAGRYGYLPEQGRPHYTQIGLEGNVWADGNVYHKAGDRPGTPKAILRLGADGKTPLPFAALATHKLVLAPAPGGSPWFAWRGMLVDRRGHVLARYSTRPDKTTYYTGVHHYGPDGRKIGTLRLTHSTYGMGVDTRGNIYVADKPRPVGAKVPADVARAFRGNVPKRIAEMYGSVIKFRPTGGGFRWTSGRPKGTATPADGNRFPPAVKLDSGVHNYGKRPRLGTAEGAEWIWVGVSYIPEYFKCICGGSDLAVDPFGRVFAPDQAACRVAVLDTNGNLIRYIGGYGNMDSRGRGSPAPEPEIAFAGIKMVTSATAREVRVADQLNGWVAVISLGYAAEARAPVDLGK